MFVEMLKEQWICFCGNWVDRMISWCPDCCEDRSAFRDKAKEATAEDTS